MVAQVQPHEIGRHAQTTRGFDWSMEYAIGLQPILSLDNKERLDQRNIFSCYSPALLIHLLDLILNSIEKHAGVVL